MVIVCESIRQSKHIQELFYSFNIARQQLKLFFKGMFYILVMELIRIADFGFRIADEGCIEPAP